MKQLLTDNCNKKLIRINGIFTNGLQFNFAKPKLFHSPSYEQALLGELFINVRNYIGKYQGNYLLHMINEECFLRLKILSTNKKCELHISSITNEEKSKIKYEKDSIILKIEDFLYFFNNNNFDLLTLK